MESYGLPKRGEFDPTTIMSFFYVFFFGMMLSDAAYGAIIAVACFVLLKKFPRMSRGMYQSIKMFMYCGISTLIWGILFGGYFGNIVDIVSQKFFGTTITVPALWFIPLNDPMKLLMYSMLFGMIHLFVGLGIKGYMCLKEKKILDFFCDVVLWFMLLIGLILMLLPSEIFSSISQIQIVFPDAVNLVAKGLAIAGAVGILLMSGRDKKNPALRLALGAYDLYNITGWLSDVLSYSRLLALGLATGSNRIGDQSDGQHAAKQYCRRDFVSRYFCNRAYAESGNQSAGSICTHESSAVCGVFSENFTREAEEHFIRSPRIQNM